MTRRAVRIGSFQFSPSWSSTLATLLLLPLLASLGMWQMSRAHYKRALEALYAERAHDVPVRLDNPIADPAPLLYRAVELTGHFDGDHTFLLDNRVQQ